MQVLDDLPLPPRDEKAPLRIPVLERKKKIGNTVVYGKVAAGTLKLGDSLRIMPSGITCQVQTIKNADKQRVPYAKAGENVAIRLNINDESLINKGDLICHRD